MANFFDPLTEEPVYNFKIPTEGTFTIGLWGGGPAGPVAPGLMGDRKLWVTSRYVEGLYDQFTGVHNALAAIEPALERDRDIGSNRRLLTFRVSRLASNKLYPLYYGSVYFPPLTLQRTDVKKSIIALARSFVAGIYDGRKAHYLWGTAGNRPGKADGNPGGGKAASGVMCRPANLPKDSANIGDPRKLNWTRMATTSVMGYNTCAGRSSMYNYNGNLKTYLDQANKLIASRGGIENVWTTEWVGDGPNDLHPRVYYWKGAVQEEGKIVWGETCDDVPHFDCVGFVNYCYAYHLNYKDFGGEIAWWADTEAKGAMCKEIKEATDVKDADVVIKKDPQTGELSHIAMVYMDGRDQKIVQAQGTAIGLNDDTPYNSGEWFKRVRMSDQYLVVMKASL
jgi:hypothetical protein